MATTLGGQTLADPIFGNEGYEVKAVEAGAFHDLADGSLAYDYVNSRWGFILRWRHITAAERNTIRTRYLVKIAQALVGPNADSYTVFVVPNSYRESYQEDGDAVLRYTCEMRLEESTA